MSPSVGDIFHHLHVTEPGSGASVFLLLIFRLFFFFCSSILRGRGREPLLFLATGP